MIQAEISIYPIATRTTSASFYIAKAIDAIKNLENIRYEINSMGTVLESDSMDVINNASKKMIETVHNLGVNRVEVIIKIDSRKDKHVKMEEKVDSKVPVLCDELGLQNGAERSPSLTIIALADSVFEKLRIDCPHWISAIQEHFQACPPLKKTKNVTNRSLLDLINESLQPGRRTNFLGISIIFDHLQINNPNTSYPYPSVW